MQILGKHWLKNIECAKVEMLYILANDQFDANNITIQLIGLFKPLASVSIK